MGRRWGLLLLWLCRPLGAAGQYDGGEMAGYYEDNEMSNKDDIIFLSENRSGKCVFPFYYNNGLFYDCVEFNAKHKWCSLTETFKGHWKYCSEEDMAKCVFPFWFRRMIYWECTEDSESSGRPWCSLTQNYNRDKIWKYCDL